MPDFENQQNSYEGRQVPMDLDAERCLLGSILRDPDVMGEAIMIIKDESFFYLEKHQLIWTALCTLNRNVTPIDLVTLAAELETMPRTAPSAGPRSIAPMAMGTMVNVITRGPTGIEDKPVIFITRMMVMKMASSVIFLRWDLLFIFPPCLCSS